MYYNNEGKLIQAVPGDKIRAMGITVTIAKVLYSDFTFDRWTGESYWDIELIDTNGNYRHWKQGYDKGEFIPSPGNNVTPEKD